MSSDINLNEYYLTVAPSVAIEQILSQTEPYRLRSNLSNAQARHVRFWSKLDNNHFQIRYKNRVRGYGNSLAPWLHGKVQPTIDGCTIQTWFEADTAVQFNQAITKWGLLFFTCVVIVLTITNLYFGTFQLSALVAFPFLAVFWGLFTFVNRLGTKLGERDKQQLLAFLEDVLKPLSNASNDGTTV